MNNINSVALSGCFHSLFQLVCEMYFWPNIWVYLNQCHVLKNTFFAWICLLYYPIFFFWSTTISSHFLVPLITHITIFKLTVIKVLKFTELNYKNEQKHLMIIPKITQSLSSVPKQNFWDASLHCTQGFEQICWLTQGGHYTFKLKWAKEMNDQLWEGLYTPWARHFQIWRVMNWTWWFILGDLYYHFALILFVLIN